jgi:hypothetical protein
MELKSNGIDFADFYWSICWQVAGVTPQIAYKISCRFFWYWLAKDQTEFCPTFGNLKFCRNGLFWPVQKVKIKIVIKFVKKNER